MKIKGNRTIKFNNLNNDNRNEEEMLCPICGNNYTHLDKVKEYDQFGRLCVDLFFYCEDGHEWVLEFNQHEGFTLPRIK